MIPISFNFPTTVQGHPNGFEAKVALKNEEDKADNATTRSSATPSGTAPYEEPWTVEDRRQVNEDGIFDVGLQHMNYSTQHKIIRLHHVRNWPTLQQGGGWA